MTPTHKRNISKAMKKQWDKPAYRKAMIEKQIKLGLRLPPK